MAPSASKLSIITNAGALLSRYDVLVCDVWGVLHNGVSEYSAAGEALEKYRAQGGTVVLLSNSPAPSDQVARIIAGKGVRPSAWDTIVSSGDLTWARITDLKLTRIHHIGPYRDLALFDGQPISLVELEDGQAVVATGLIDDANETAEDYRDLLGDAVALGLPLICANPDRIVDVGGVLLPCAGVLGDVYEELGGRVYWEGKPYPHAYDVAISAAAAAAGRAVARKRVLAIGDSIGTDMTGATRAGLESLFIAQGIHRDEVIANGVLSSHMLLMMLAPGGNKPVAAMIELAW